ncbi:hypothetical protein [Priestia megaterium]|uniref:hypothetical protein n=1 Tax=Priestia megaterium TaxID=1404 RepID=UPI0031FE371A
MAKKNLTITYTEETESKLVELVEFFDKASVGTVNKSDVLKYLIDKANDEIIVKGKSLDRIFNYEK